ncbi:MAG: hypothetical protein EOM55_01275 [Clostridia bacterium]|nr:hypothetical protein [Clostridia bacterium]
MNDENLEQLENSEIETENDLEKTQFDGSKKDEQMSFLGKFKDAQSLFVAYNNLQSDYTRKCQALSSLQRKFKDKIDELSPENFEKSGEEKIVKEKLSTLEKDTLLQEYIFSNEDLKSKILTKYFDEIYLPKSPKLISGDRGSNPILSPISKPKTLEQAQSLVRDMFDKK